MQRLTVTAQQNGYQVLEDGGKTGMLFAPTPLGERAFEDYMLQALARLKDTRRLDLFSRAALDSAYVTCDVCSSSVRADIVASNNHECPVCLSAMEV